MRYLILLLSVFSSIQAFPFSIRAAQEGEIGVVFNLICELAEFEGKDVASLAVTKEHLQEFGFGKNSYFSVELAEIEGKIVGYALYFFGFSGWQGYPILYVDDLYVSAGYREAGIGTALLKKLAAYGQQHNCCRLEWHVFDWNDSAISFYQKIGGHLRKDLLLVRLERDALNQLAQN